MAENNSRAASVQGILQEEQNLLSAAKDLLQKDNHDRADALLDLLHAHTSKNENYNLVDILELSSKSILEGIWEASAQAVDMVAADQSYLIKDVTEDVDDDMLSVEESLMADEKNRQLLATAKTVSLGSLNVLRAVSSLILLSVTKAPTKDNDALMGSVGRKPLPQMLAALKTLHSLLFSVAAQSEEGEFVTVIIARCCERWWTCNYQNKEELVTQLLPYLIASAMTESSTPADLKRLNGVRHALELLDFDHPSAETIKNLIVRCATTPLFLKRAKKAPKKHKKKKSDFIVDDNDDMDDNDNDNDDVATESTSAMSEGQRILSYAFNLNPNLTKEMWNSIKNALKFQTKTIWSSYGTILFRAWKACEDQDVLDVLEQNIVQDLMECGTKVADKVCF